ncbi:MAG: hypothetical protein OJF50_003088 [Nitrospira sp.]|nr:hypothetical protein [Nitrospira sp.]
MFIRHMSGKTTRSSGGFNPDYLVQTLVASSRSGITYTGG